MATGYTQSQLDTMEAVLGEVSPELPEPDDKEYAFEVTAIRAAGTDVGVLINFGFKGGKSLLLMLNCVVVRELMLPLAGASMGHEWHTRGLMPAPSDHLQDPLPEHLATARQVTGLSTYGMPDGVLVSLFMPDEGIEGEVVTLFLPVRAVLELVVILSNAGDREGWWTRDFELIPTKASQN